MGEMKPAKRTAQGSQHGGITAKKLLGGVMIIIESRGIAYAPPPPQARGLKSFACVFL